MAEIIKNRTIRPSTRGETSKTYRVHTESVSYDDILIVNIFHEAKKFSKTYKFNGADIAHKNSIHFKVIDNGHSININWIGVTPFD
jgi:hypothetical protein